MNSDATPKKKRLISYLAIGLVIFGLVIGVSIGLFVVLTNNWNDIESLDQITEEMLADGRTAGRMSMFYEKQNNRFKNYETGWDSLNGEHVMLYMKNIHMKNNAEIQLYIDVENPDDVILCALFDDNTLQYLSDGANSIVVPAKSTIRIVAAAAGTSNNISILTSELSGSVIVDNEI